MQVYGQGGGKKWRRVNVHCTSVFSLLFAVLRQAVSTLWPPHMEARVVSCHVDWTSHRETRF